MAAMVVIVWLATKNPMKNRTTKIRLVFNNIFNEPKKIRLFS